MGQDKCTERELFLRVRSLVRRGCSFVSAHPHYSWFLLHELLTFALAVLPQTLYVGAVQPQTSSEVNPLVGIDCSSQNQLEAVLWTGEIVFTIIFLLEMIVKIIARGFFAHPHAYLRDRLNWLDFIVVVSGTISVMLTWMALPPSNFTQVEFLLPTESANN
jgi:hypothetical protein